MRGLCEITPGGTRGGGEGGGRGAGERQLCRVISGTVTTRGKSRGGVVAVMADLCWDRCEL